MKQPATPNAAEETKAEQNQTGAKQKPKKIPTATELISHYQKRGLEPAEASVKVIEDLQNALVRVVSSSKNNASSKDKLLTDARKIDAVNGRLAVVDAKLETKPGYVETFVLGLASGAALNGINAVWPHVTRGIGQAVLCDCFQLNLGTMVSLQGSCVTPKPKGKVWLLCWPYGPPPRPGASLCLYLFTGPGHAFPSTRVEQPISPLQGGSTTGLRGPRLEQKIRQAIPWLLWQIWKARNSHTFKATVVPLRFQVPKLGVNRQWVLSNATWGPPGSMRKANVVCRRSSETHKAILSHIAGDRTPQEIREVLLSPRPSPNLNWIIAQINALLEHIEFWRLDHVVEERNEASNLIAKSVTTGRMYQSYIASQGPAWLQSLLILEALFGNALGASRAVGLGLALKEKIGD
uniref:RNase H type-1 domain-containing protein n=1 Tax=Brassica oleracea var. oleracea TaxID=109376 RepID=A0A0D3DPW8_BRAOL